MGFSSRLFGSNSLSTSTNNNNHSITSLRKSTDGSNNNSKKKKCLVFLFQHKKFVAIALMLVMLYIFFYFNNDNDYYYSYSSSSGSSTMSLSLLQGGFVSTGTISGAIFTGIPYRTYTGKRWFAKQGWERNIGKKKLDWKTISTYYLYSYYQEERNKQRKQQQETSTTTTTSDALDMSATDVSMISCKKWAVVTTIFPPSEALIDIATNVGSSTRSGGNNNNDNWCIVVVGDTKTDKNWLLNEPRLHNLNDNDSNGQQAVVVFLSIEEQEQWMKTLPGEIGTFIQHLPRKHFARKNIGFLYAILRGATFVYDFDDDNYLNKYDITAPIITEQGSSISNDRLHALIDNENHIDNVRFITMDSETTTTSTTSTTTIVKAFNHHPLMKASMDTSWPRGFPLELIQDPTTHGIVLSTDNTVSMDQVGVIQYCANNNPDIDAIHRLTKPLPMNFAPDQTWLNEEITIMEEDEEEPETTTIEIKGSSPILVPSNVYVPYNAQATIHTSQALFATLLPMSVSSRVTDIWRSFFAQCIFRDIGLSVIIAPPRITQYRNVHNILGDLQSEQDLYYKSNKLIEFLHDWEFVDNNHNNNNNNNNKKSSSSSWGSSTNSIPTRMEELWIHLYERGYIELEDVELVQLWLGTLVQINYPFRIPNK